MIQCAEEQGVCSTVDGRTTVSLTPALHNESLLLRIRRDRAYVVVLHRFNQDPRWEADNDDWFRPSPYLRQLSAMALCRYKIDSCSCAGANCRPGGGFVAAHWRAENSPALRSELEHGDGSLRLCASLLVQAVEAAWREAQAEVNGAASTDGINVLLIADLLPGTSTTHGDETAPT